MLKESLLIVARHIGNDIGVKITTERDAVPQVRGNHITLPSNLSSSCYDFLIGATIHEAGHVAYTHKQLDIPAYLFPFLNVLEDIRIDNLLFSRYSGVKETYFEVLVSTALKQTKDKDSIDAKILKSLILKGEGFAEYDYEEPEIKRFFSLHRGKMDTFILAAQSSKSTSELVPFAEELAGLFISEEEAKQILNEPAVTLGRKQAELQSELKEKERQKGQCYCAKQKAKKNFEAANKECDKGNTREKELAHLTAELEKATLGYEEAKKSVRLVKDDIRITSKQIKAQEIKGSEKLKEIYQQRGIETIGLFGFEHVPIAFEEDKFEIKQTTKEMLRALCEFIGEDVITGNGRVNPKKLANVYTSPETVLNGKVTKREIRTKIAFLLDSSGSMRSNNAAGIVIQTMQELIKILDEIVDEVPIDQLSYAIYAFDHEVFCIKDFADYTANWNMYYPRGDTMIGHALEYVEECIGKIDTAGTKVIIFCLTDGAIIKSDEKFLLNFSQYPVIFLGIRPGTIGTHELFRRYAVNDLTELNDVLIRAIEENLAC